MNESTLCVVNFSGGLASYAALDRSIKRFGRENVIALFADVRGDVSRDSHAAPIGTNWDGEDDDAYRFIDDIERATGVDMRRVKHPDGIGVWGAIFRERAITMAMPGGTFAPCTKLLKQETLDAAITEIFATGRPVTLVTGLGWHEKHRVEKLRQRLGSNLFYDLWFPMLDEPLIGNDEIEDDLCGIGIAPPRTYSAGFAHGNCGGACVKAGQAQWVRLLRVNPLRYAYNEAQEAQFRREINPDVSILRDRRGGETKALTLSDLRERVQSGQPVEENYEWGGCGCFAGAIPQEEVAQ